MRASVKNKIIFGICLLLSLLQPFSMLAGATAADNQEQYIYDDAGLLSSADFEALDTLCKEYGAEAGIKIIILTHNDSRAKDGEIYIEDFYDKMLFGDSVILLVDMYNRDVVLEGYGLAETYIHSKRGDIIINDIIPFLTAADYRKAFELFIKSSASYMKDDSELNYDYNYIYDNPPSSNDNITYDPGLNYGNNYFIDNNSRYNNTTYRYNSNVDNLLLNIWFQLFAAMAIAGIVVGMMAYHSGGKMTAGSNTYIDSKNSRLIGRKDQYIRTSVTRVRKPTQNNNTGGGGFNAGGFRGGVSSGGRSHSTSRGKF